MKLLIYFFSCCLFFYSYTANAFLKSDIEKCVDAQMEVWEEKPFVEYGDPAYKGKFSTGWDSRKYKDNGIPKKHFYADWLTKKEFKAASWNRCLAFAGKKKQ